MGEPEPDWLSWKALASVVAVPAGFGVTLGAAFLFSQHSPWDTNEWAAVVQAVGSIIGIGIAIYVPWRQDSNRMREEAEQQRRQARALALLLFADVVFFITSIKTAIEDEHSRDVRVTVPGSLINRAADMWMLGEAGDALLQAISTVSNHNLVVEYASERGASLQETHWDHQALAQQTNKNARVILGVAGEAAHRAQEALHQLMTNA